VGYYCFWKFSALDAAKLYIKYNELNWFVLPVPACICGCKSHLLLRLRPVPLSLTRLFSCCESGFSLMKCRWKLSTTELNPACVIGHTCFGLEAGLLRFSEVPRRVLFLSWLSVLFFLALPLGAFLLRDHTEY
jgi:hypothetical protein